MSQPLEGAKVIETAGICLQMGNIEAFVLSQVVEAMKDLNKTEIQEMSEAIAPFERRARKRHK